MIRRPPRSTLDRSSAASDVYKRQDEIQVGTPHDLSLRGLVETKHLVAALPRVDAARVEKVRPIDSAEDPEFLDIGRRRSCLLYTSDAADERSSVDLGGRRIIKKKNQDADVRIGYS